MASAACRTRIASPVKVFPSPATPISNRARKLSAGQIAETLFDLCAMGLVETFKDEYGITRFRPTNGRRA